MAVGDRIPKEIRQDVIRVFEWVKECMPYPSKEHLAWLFEVYNTYVEPHNCKKMTCKTDINRVLAVISTYIKQWKN